MTEKYTMSLDMRVLQHLGIRLYSNVAAVISELVANSWDAEATLVDIKFDGDDKITIVDNGNGMSEQQINGRFLNVGYEKRKTEGGKSAKFGRNFMGRKGIGKLSVLSMAEQVDIFSSQDGQHNALRIRVDALEDAIDKQQPYHPDELAFDDSIAKVGTTIVLSKLLKKRTGITISALRKRLARRFSVFGHRGIAGDKFDVSINGKLVDYSDRDDLRSLEFLWEFGEKIIPDASVPNLHERYIIKNNQIPGQPNWLVEGWFGTAKKPADLEHDADAGSMRNIVVLARGRLIQESILDKLGFNRIFGSYVTGLIQADFLDTEDREDIATSDRQRLIEDDPRVISLRNFMRQELLDASEVWSISRRVKKSKDALLQFPALERWVNDLPEGQRPAARSMLGLIGELQLDSERESDRKELYRSGVLAFERLRLKETAHNLERLTSLDASQLLPLLVAQDYFESALYADIVRTRIQAIQQFQSLTNAKAKETVLQKHLFDNLWLLDAGWERVESSKTIEHRLARDYPKEFSLKLNSVEKTGRIDIKYRKSSGVHIIVELKKYERKVKLDELQAQGKKYRAAMFKLATQDGEASPRVEIVFVLGQPVEDDFSAGLPANHVDTVLETFKGRVTFYDSLIKNALTEYEDYLKANAESDRIEQVLNGISESASLSVSKSEPRFSAANPANMKPSAVSACVPARSNKNSASKRAKHKPKHRK